MTATPAYFPHDLEAAYLAATAARDEAHAKLTAARLGGAPWSVRHSLWDEFWTAEDFAKEALEARSIAANNRAVT